MFLAKFSEVSANAKNFKADSKKNMPFIGTVLAGTARGTIINGTIFKSEGLLPNKTYACQNVTEMYQGKEQIRTQVIGEVSFLEFSELEQQLGAPQLIKSSDATE